MTTILAIDPGNTHSGVTLIDATTRQPLKIGKLPNHEVLDLITNTSYNHLRIEMIASYGMAVGATVFDTCVWIGRFIQHHKNRVAEYADYALVFRKDIKLHHCKTAAAKDSNITQALIDRFAPNETNRGKGTKKNPGWFHGFKADIWQAYALAVYTADTIELESDSGTVGDVLSCPDAQGAAETYKSQVLGEWPLAEVSEVVVGVDLGVVVPAFVVGSLVRVGRGKKLWRVESLWADRPVASLKPLEGYTGTTVDVERLVAVSEKEAA